ncbi:hypothetical protein [Paraburkholderia sp.]|uniref:hypothetical protein n=1 Tax=Paraburkholderia sp. TaxID=1926495 RepID=UPI002B000067|nr:hypothetical protein [Paraburkholderia sp.]
MDSFDWEKQREQIRGDRRVASKIRIPDQIDGLRELGPVRCVVRPPLELYKPPALEQCTIRSLF